LYRRGNQKCTIQKTGQIIQRNWPDNTEGAIKNPQSRETDQILQKGLCIFDCPFGIIWLVSLDYLASFSRLCIFDRPSIFSKVYIHVCIRINPCHYIRRVFILIFCARNNLFSLLLTFYNSILIECKSLTSHEATGIYLLVIFSEYSDFVHQ
jgi:hypothetical protein